MHEIFEVVVMAISTLGAVVVVWGTVESLIAFLSLKFSPRRKDPIQESDRIRQRLGSHLLLGLEIFIGGDIISSVISPSWEKVGILAAIVGVRTVLSYFLRRELKQEMP